MRQNNLYNFKLRLRFFPSSWPRQRPKLTAGGENAQNSEAGQSKRRRRGLRPALFASLCTLCISLHSFFVEMTEKSDKHGPFRQPRLSTKISRQCSDSHRFLPQWLTHFVLMFLCTEYSLPHVPFQRILATSETVRPCPAVSIESKTG